MLKAEARNYAKTFTLELYACEFCELCVQVCPTDAIVMTKSFDLATADRRDAAARQGPAARARRAVPRRRGRPGNRLRDMQAPPKKVEAEATPSPGEARHDPRSRRVLGAGHRPGRLGAGRRAQQEPVPLGAVAGAGADGTAGIFLLLDAEFLAAVQVLLYAGGVITVVVFAIVVTERLVGERLSHTSRSVVRRRGRGHRVPARHGRVDRAASAAAGATRRPRATSTKAHWQPLLTRFVLPFELLARAAARRRCIGASYFARPED